MTESTIVMTGATAGLGAHAARILAQHPDTHLIVGARGSGREVPGAQVKPLDLASLDSVRQFAETVGRELGDTPIRVLILNAGLQFRDTDHRTVDGFETTFAVNHLAHYLLARLLLPRIADGGRLVITTSDTHDPSIIPFGPRALDPARLAHPESAGAIAGLRAYASSKLCNLLTARSFAASDEVVRRRIDVVAYNPGLTLGTNLVGESMSGRVVTGVLRPVLRLLSAARPAFYPGRVETAGEALADLSIGAVKPPEGRLYASLVKGQLTFPDPAPLARDDRAADGLWRASAAMIGI
ncbi:protochlorophyllide reductase [Mycobacteroides abscessus subsp. bolletii]|uniref:Protochlorophyllide reductase n=1 Tax=Mycobacteroides abscessus subsp. bolletii TaxID=319705 RepID=A0A9Q7WLB1_9MYCO|nr:SDR family NAD(P)-dependent oxidoreductase [Mycobacteroides abscessus]SHT70157.1 protochlorophyllide reductase [Mycobacteroides abscessus subsp. bolletii]SHU43461.1 protochlorophyllide reductase [Mycobacteroides abscessus subsp. bolletii]SHV12250.1 protochlorophyllide reductase [Mycobacteroides abscessus subsp. bolletii]SHW81188.1 protochlorophyllide reductase [Mycobacteroides abscessus subsp. bolletii]SHY00482.1 protochlorophyllide reductase [Mycobacteroides abscessus subsp. bolletii]